MSTMYVDNIVEKTSANGVHIPGHVIQVVQGLGNTARQTYSSTSYFNLIIVSITPKFSTSKILISGHTSLTRSASAYIDGRITRGYSTQLLHLDTQAGYIAGLTNNEHSMGSLSGEILDAPSTTSVVDYRIQLKISGGSGSIYIDGQPSITAMEIAQ